MNSSRTIRFFAALLAGVNLGVVAGSRSPLALHPDNPRYFLFRGEPTVLITSGEHYGAVLNQEFDYAKYLDTLARDGLNLTRTFSGAYVEPDGAFNIARNTLAPGPGRFLAPWARSDVPGYANGGNKFDLTRWDEAYFARLKGFVAHAARRGVVVEVNLFCPFYEEKQWALSPQNAANNVNGLGQVARTNVYTLDRHGGLLAVHEALTRQIVTVLNPFDNVYYEICNEPYFGGVTLAWQHHIAEVIVDTERSLPQRHLISQNIANGRAKVESPHPAVSIFNFHYAYPPDTVALNAHLNRAIGDNETGFRGTNDLPYRVEAWNFLLAGGALFNHLDYSFVVGHEDGTFVYPATQPGGGNPGFRRQMRVLAEFIGGFDLRRMKPMDKVAGLPAGGLTARVLAEPGRAYAVYLSRTLEHPDEFSVRWVGTIEPPVSGAYTFYADSNDGVRVWVGDQATRVIDDWSDHSVREAQGTVTLEGGRRHVLEVQYYQAGGGAALKLRWSGPGVPKQVIPAERLRVPGGTGQGLHGEYYAGKDFNRRRLARTDATLDFDWTNRSPFAEPGTGRLADTPVITTLEVPAGRYRAEWVSPLTGRIERKITLQHPGGALPLEAPSFGDDIALRLQRRGG